MGEKFEIEGSFLSNFQETVLGWDQLVGDVCVRDPPSPSSKPLPLAAASFLGIHSSIMKPAQNPPWTTRAFHTPARLDGGDIIKTARTKEHSEKKAVCRVDDPWLRRRVILRERPCQVVQHTPIED